MEEWFTMKKGKTLAITALVATVASVLLLAGTVLSTPPRIVPMAQSMFYTSLMNGYKLSPPVASEGFAGIEMWLHKMGGDVNSYEINFDLYWQNLEGNVTRAYLSLGEPWLGGKKILTLCEPCPVGTTGSYRRGGFNVVKPDEFNYSGSFDNFTDFIRALWFGRVWVIIETTKYPSGEVGGVLVSGKN
jgi:hypothetical protein